MVVGAAERDEVEAVKVPFYEGKGTPKRCALGIVARAGITRFSARSQVSHSDYHKVRLSQTRKSILRAMRRGNRLDSSSPRLLVAL
jgi:hypothetical protein